MGKDSFETFDSLKGPINGKDEDGSRDSSEGLDADGDDNVEELSVPEMPQVKR